MTDYLFPIYLFNLSYLHLFLKDVKNKQKKTDFNILVLKC